MFVWVSFGLLLFSLHVTSTNGVSPRNYLPPQHRDILDSLIRDYAQQEDAGETVAGARFLGSPLGGKFFANKYLTEAFHNKCSQPLQDARIIPDLQAAFVLLRHSWHCRCCQTQIQN